MIKEVDGKHCCGCGACYCICKQHAIIMDFDEKGFLFPRINSKYCTECGRCIKVCPVINFEVYENCNYRNPIKKAFTAEDAIVYNSSSGGAFATISCNILAKNGVVFGAAYTKDFEIKHIYIEKEVELRKLQGSKYAQSNQGKAYIYAKNFLKEGRYVLYSGTPCQISGLKNFLNKEYDNLLTIELLCHGVPSVKLLQSYIENKYNFEDIESINMRGKEKWDLRFEILFKNSDKVILYGNKSSYIYGFHNDLFLRDSCYNCLFASLPRQADFTIGDFWNVRKLKIGQPFEKKCSIILINNTKADNYYHEITKVASIHTVDISHIDNKKLNKNIYNPNAKYTNKVKIFWENIKKMPFNDAVLKTMHPGKNVGLVLYASDNYGSCATNYALYKIIKNIGYTPIILDSIVKIRGLSREFLSQNCTISSKFIKDGDVDTINKLCNYFVVGSDNSFKISDTFTRNNIEYFTLSFAKKDSIKIAWAPSLGIPNIKDIYTVNLYKNLLTNFNFLSFREFHSIEYAKKYFNADAKQVIDPIFFLNKNDFEEISNDVNLKLSKKYLLAYILDMDIEKLNLIYKLSNILNLEIFIILDARHFEKQEKLLNNKMF